MSKKTYYHTQESRRLELLAPIPCTREDAWLGNAIYYWVELEDAEDWGNTSKRRHNTDYKYSIVQISFYSFVL